MRMSAPIVFALAVCAPRVTAAQAALAATAPSPALRTDSVAPRTAARITGGESTTRVAVVQTRGADSLVPRLLAAAGDTTPILRRAARACGPQRVCPAGWDVAAVGVRVPVPAVPTLVPVTVRVGFTNRGSVASPAAEAKVCWTGPWDGGDCGDHRMLEVPPIAPLDTAWLAVVLPASQASSDGDARVAVVFDPDRVTGEKKADNNRAASGDIAIETKGKLDWGTWSGALVGDAVVATFEVRNTARVAAVRRGEFVVETRVSCGQQNFTTAKANVTIEELPARVGATFTVAVPLPARVAGGVRRRQCAIDYVSVGNAEGRYDYPPPSVPSIYTDAIVVEPGR